MITVKVEGLAAAQAMLNGQAKQVRYATAVALTKTAHVVRETLPAVLDRELDRPTPFTKRGLFVSAARKDKLEATVGFMDRQASYMKYQIAGGTRQPGARGIKIPGNIQLNAFGNIPRGLIDKLKASAQSGVLGKTIAKRLGVTGNRRKGAAPIQLFYGKPAGRRWEKAPMGIYRRIPGNPGKLVPVVVFEDTPARYRPRVNFQRHAADIVRREWSAQFDAAIADALRTAH